MNNNVILRLEGINKSFGSVHALKDVDLTVKTNEIHGLLGGNGAGKTTLMNVLYGLYKSDSGTISLRGQVVDIQSPKAAIAHGIGMVHQHFLQVNNFTVTENIVLGTRLENRPTMDLAEPEKRIRDLSTRFGLDIDPRSRIEDLPMGVRQRVEILKALYRGVDILILDEPTTNLTPQEVDSLFDSLKLMVSEGMSVVFITHKLREVLNVCDTITVLYEGERHLTIPRSEASEQVIIRAMVGLDVAIDESVLFSDEAPRPDRTDLSERAVVLQVKDLSIDGDGDVPLVDAATFAVHAGEILGIAGVAGNGQQELIEGILGIRPLSRGQVWYEGKEVTAAKTSRLLTTGISYVPEDRLQDGFLPTANIGQNLILGTHRLLPYSSRGFMRWRSVYETARSLINEYHIHTQSPQDVAANLSGGNIQRMMLARAFSRPVKLLILHNPTSGLDIPSVEAMYQRILERVDQGMATLLLSDNLDELLRLSDRIATMYRGGIVGILDRDQFDKYVIGRMMSGVAGDD